ncbi:NlpC/P60 family protein [Putridiphycobacter roseus]|uniref:NlpC/P60 family protein n=1 Tax=Putridiphycobacter roseus TaxID=2219161 RepID=A0A2W1NKX4_9FLAO|nr:C40 family peptidase [Putridiphycobacter roseus]PZE18506.1 NlpC/P60 family protein [Putridiphycobacter roseus]
MTKILVILLFLGSFTQSIAQDDKDSLRIELVKYATSFTGVRYQYGGVTSKGFDCSGFLYHSYRNFNFKVPRTSSGYAAHGKKITLAEAKPGDVIVFTGTNPKIRKPGHVGIVLSNEAGSLVFIHASSSKKHSGVVRTELNKSNYQARFLYIKNVIHE